MSPQLLQNELASKTDGNHPCPSVPAPNISLSGGADIGQFDDPQLCLFVDKRVQAEFEDWRSEAELCVDLLNQIVDGVDGIKTAVHLCRRNKGRGDWVGEGGYGMILPFLKKLNVHQFVMEFTIQVAGDFDVLRELPDPRLSYNSVSIVAQVGHPARRGA